MQPYSLSHLSDGALLRDLAALVARDRATTAALLAHIAEVDARRLYVPAGYASMHNYCVQALHLSEDSAYKRIHAGRTAREFPAIFPAIADGRLHLSAVILLAPHLEPDHADELLAAAAHQSKAAIERLIAERFPQPDVPTQVQAIASGPTAGTLKRAAQHAPGRVETPERVEAPSPRPRVAPLAPQRFALQLTMGQALHDKLRYAQQLLSHQVPAGDLAAVLERALDALIPTLEKRKFAKTSRPGRRRATTSARHVPAHVRCAVWERDQGQCTFVGENGHRCGAREFLEFDHIDPVARGGQATLERMRLRCRAHNQFEAERTFGVEFMKHKRQEARRAAAEAKARAAEAKTRADEAKTRAAEVKAHATKEARDRAAKEAQARAADAARARAAATATAQERDVIPWLRQLGFRADEAHRAAAHCETLPDAPLEERVRVALSFLRPHCRTQGPAVQRVAPAVATASRAAASSDSGWAVTRAPALSPA